MKTLIVYVSKRGTTKESAFKISESIKGDVVDIKQIKKFKIDNYEQIIIGTYLYAGMVPNKIKKFCISNLDLLKNKRIAFYIMGIGPEVEMTEVFKKQMPNELIEKVVAIGHFGGELRMEKANFFEKIILKKVMEKEKFEPKINDAAIKKFIENIKVG